MYKGGEGPAIFESVFVKNDKILTGCYLQILCKNQAENKRTIHKPGYLTALDPGGLHKKQETDASLSWVCHLFVTFQEVLSVA